VTAIETFVRSIYGYGCHLYGDCANICGRLFGFEGVCFRLLRLQQLVMDNKAPWQLLGEEFVRQYYQVFDTNREQLVALYAVSVMTFPLFRST